MKGLVFVVFLFTEFNGCELANHEIHMEQEEQSYEHPDNNWKNVRSHYEVGYFVIKTSWVVHSTLKYWVRCANNCPGSHHTVEYHAQEVLVIIKTDAICYPRTVVVHLEDASIALWAMMTPIRFCFVAPLTYSNSSKSLPFNRYHFLLACLVCIGTFDTWLFAVLLANQWSFSGYKILIVFMLMLTRELDLSLN